MPDGAETPEAGHGRSTNGSRHAPGFRPLRTDPPPHLFATWWLRYLLFLSQTIGVVVVLLHEYAAPGGMDATVIVVPHVLAATMLVAWSALAMLDAARLIPPARYARPARARVAVVLWLLAFAAPVAAVATVRRAQVRFTEGDDLGVVAATSVILMICFLLVWLPFRYHTRQAHRIGAPTRIVGAWFWLPLFAVVGVLVIDGMGLHELIAEDGVTAAERTVQLGVLFGVPAMMFAFSTWRATTVFDEVIDLRWNRWRTDWEQTLAALAAQPPPGPEASPSIDRR